MSFAFNIASIVLFLLNYVSLFPQEYIFGISAGLGLAGMTLWFAGYAVGRSKD